MDPDEICMLCGSKRDEHGDRQHVFSADGDLIEKKKPEPPRQKPPVHRDDPKPQVPDTQMAFLNLVDILIEKGVLDAKDIVRILSGRGK